ncbi:MAG: hypothetical protein WC855_11515 [Thermodesulfovibrionales bacterium]
MSITIRRLKGWGFLFCSMLLILFVTSSHAETDKQTTERMVKEAKESAERSEKKEKEEKGETNYDVKKTHDEHIKETEKAAGEAAKTKE